MIMECVLSDQLSMQLVFSRAIIPTQVSNSCFFVL